MLKLSLFVFLVVAAVVESQSPAAAPQQPAAMPVIIWGSCPQLEPSEADKKTKSDVLANCLKQFPIPAELTQEKINTRKTSRLLSILVLSLNLLFLDQKSVAECALKMENWVSVWVKCLYPYLSNIIVVNVQFEKDGSYKFSKAESEIKKKKLDSKMETELLKAHVTCRDEAKAKVTDKVKVVEQVQLYQACVS